MKRLKEIKLMVQIAEQGWSEIEGKTSNLSGFTADGLAKKKEKLKNLLEDIRVNIESFLIYSRCSALMRVCREFLDRILMVSENLRVSYVFPGYTESYYILDTLRFIDGPDER